MSKRIKTIEEKYRSKLFREYERAAWKLVEERNREFPIGTKVSCKILSMVVTVVSGSLYPDQINTTIGHMSWCTIEKVEQDEKD